MSPQAPLPISHRLIHIRYLHLCVHRERLLLVDPVSTAIASQQYVRSTQVPALYGRNYCPHCLCSPCVVELPPDFLRGSCGPHPANDYKRYQLYKQYWRLLKAVGLWQTEECKRRKEHPTDRREKIPQCIIEV